MTRATASWFIVAGFTLVWLGLSVTLITRAGMSYDGVPGGPESSKPVAAADTSRPSDDPQRVRRALLDAPSIAYATGL